MLIVGRVLDRDDKKICLTWHTNENKKYENIGFNYSCRNSDICGRKKNDCHIFVDVWESI